MWVTVEPVVRIPKRSLCFGARPDKDNITCGVHLPLHVMYFKHLYGIREKKTDCIQHLTGKPEA